MCTLFSSMAGCTCTGPRPLLPHLRKPSVCMCLQVSNRRRRHTGGGSCQVFLSPLVETHRSRATRALRWGTTSGALSLGRYIRRCRTTLDYAGWSLSVRSLSEREATASSVTPLSTRSGRQHEPISCSGAALGINDLLGLREGTPSPWTAVCQNLDEVDEAVVQQLSLGARV